MQLIGISFFLRSLPGSNPLIYRLVFSILIKNETRSGLLLELFSSVSEVMTLGLLQYAYTLQ